MKNLFIVAILLFLLVSCGITKRDFNVAPKAKVEENFLEVNSSNAFTKVATAQNWWSEFNDPILDSLIEKARKHNMDINSAVANVFASRALFKETKFDRVPTVTANGNYTRTRLGENVFVQGSNPTYSNYNGSFDAFWEADLFGRVSNRIKGAYANNQLAVADMQGVYVSIFAEVANNYMELRGSQYLLDIAHRNLKGQQDTYDLTVKLSEAGTSNNLDVSRALAQLENTRATIPPLKANIEALKNRLSVLIGEVPGNLDSTMVEKQPLPSLPSSVALGDVNELLRRRPDVRRAEAALQIQIARYNLSVAELYPKIQFVGSIGFSAVDFSNFGSKESFTWSVMPNISWAAFNLGRVKQQIKGNDALTFASLNQYEKTVLNGLEEIRTALSNYSNELQRKETLRASSEASAEAAKFAKQRYNAGLDSFIDFLSADNSLLQSENLLARSEISSATSLIAIYKALGGGWEIISENELNNKFEQMKHLEDNSK
ncbi:efflux transporter outer membrane subunit [Arenibacter palladensis]|uniref:efflux transporter outer membrane subunit n=1 Tax=Arenibacter palladensis TaxID=237373 RepID=UPI0026E342A4|nr:TolC family protein [Arenibacter palladensis]MDO6602129.1 TolC family protein [Arenibacter palladensis]